MYLLFNNEADALARSEQAGIDKGLAYHKGDPNGTRYIWRVIVEETDTNPRAALDIVKITGKDYRNLLTGAETSALLDNLPDDWVQTTDD
tara:strand:- start:768 stop:1037 length:270 start_codon:yes stop_codon:yes gene_type:complete